MDEKPPTDDELREIYRWGMVWRSLIARLAGTWAFLVRAFRASVVAIFIWEIARKYLERK